VVRCLMSSVRVLGRTDKGTMAKSPVTNDKIGASLKLSNTVASNSHRKKAH